jgi:hypothetical protein
VLAGLADWASHRATRISTTSGLKENLLHWLMYAEIGVGMVAVAYFEINAALVAIVLGVFLVHEITVYMDLDYSTMVRDVGPFEQMVHSFLEMLPLVSMGLLAVIAWPHGWDFDVRPKEEPIRPEYLVAAGAASVLFNALPLLQETWSCVRDRALVGRRREPVEPTF